MRRRYAAPLLHLPPLVSVAAVGAVHAAHAEAADASTTAVVSRPELPLPGARWEAYLPAFAATLALYGAAALLVWLPLSGGSPYAYCQVVQLAWAVLVGLLCSATRREQIESWPSRLVAASCAVGILGTLVVSTHSLCLGWHMSLGLALAGVATLPLLGKRAHATQQPSQRTSALDEKVNLS